MSRILLLMCILFLNGCAPKYPAVANLNLEITPQPPIFSGSSAYIEGHDARENEEVILYQLPEQPPIWVPNMNPPHILATERLAGGLREQGLMFESSAGVRILLEINELQVTVTKPKFLFAANAKTRVTLKVVKGGTSLAKKYEREATKESPQRPNLDKLETMLNDQLSEVINQILDDEDIRRAISVN